MAAPQAAGRRQRPQPTSGDLVAGAVVCSCRPPRCACLPVRASFGALRPARQSQGSLPRGCGRPGLAWGCCCLGLDDGGCYAAVRVVTRAGWSRVARQAITAVPVTMACRMCASLRSLHTIALGLGPGSGPLRLTRLPPQMRQAGRILGLHRLHCCFYARRLQGLVAAHEQDAAQGQALQVARRGGVGWAPQTAARRAGWHSCDGAHAAASVAATSPQALPSSDRRGSGSQLRSPHPAWCRRPCRHQLRPPQANSPARQGPLCGPQPAAAAWAGLPGTARGLRPTR